MMSRLAYRLNKQKMYKKLGVKYFELYLLARGWCNVEKKKEKI